MTRKIIFLDVDGTIIDYDNHIPESAVTVIRQAREKGHLVYVCTGRSKAEMPPEIWDIGFDGMIGGNGSYVEHEEEVILHQLIPRDVAKRLVDWPRRDRARRAGHGHLQSPPQDGADRSRSHHHRGRHPGASL